MKLQEVKNSGQKNVNLNGFLESVDYVMSISASVKHIGETKSSDGYSIILQ